MFKDMSKKEIINFFKDANYTIQSYSKDDIIALEDNHCTRVGLVLSGNVDIKRVITSDKVVLLSSFTKGNLFGEVIAFSDMNVYPATVISSSNSEVMFIEKDDFVLFCTKKPEFLKMFLNEVTNKVIRLNNSIKTLSYVSIRQKIARYILDQYTIQRRVFIEMNMSKQKLSEMLGIPRPSLSREFINMKNDGIIDYSRDYIKILKIDKLEEILVD